VDSLSELRHEFELYRRLTGARLRGQMQYKRSFLLQLVGNFVLNFSELLAIFILFQHFETLGGWTRGEIAFLYGLSAVPFGLADIIGSGFSAFQNLMRRGDFDRILTRPASSYVQTLASEFHIHQFGRVFQGVLALVIAFNEIDISWTSGRIVYLPIVALSIAALFLGLFTLEATFCFWTTEATEAVNAFTYGGTTLAQYPMHIYERWMRSLFIWIVPLGLVLFLPAVYLLGKEDPLGLPTFLQFVSPLAAVVFIVLASLIWRTGVRHYRSTGS
jgi:ABC-2 type transport system permease protein